MSNVVFPFGKYKSKKLSEIPTSYLKWAQANVNFYNKNLKKEVEYEILDREAIEDELYRESILPQEYDEELAFKFNLNPYYFIKG